MHVDHQTAHRSARGRPQQPALQIAPVVAPAHALGPDPRRGRRRWRRHVARQAHGRLESARQQLGRAIERLHAHRDHLPRRVEGDRADLHRLAPQRYDGPARRGGRRLDRNQCRIAVHLRDADPPRPAPRQRREAAREARRQVDRGAAFQRHLPDLAIGGGQVAHEPADESHRTAIGPHHRPRDLHATGVEQLAHVAIGQRHRHQPRDPPVVVAIARRAHRHEAVASGQPVVVVHIVADPGHQPRQPATARHHGDALRVDARADLARHRFARLDRTGLLAWPDGRQEAELRAIRRPARPARIAGDGGQHPAGRAIGPDHLGGARAGVLLQQHDGPVVGVEQQSGERAAGAQRHPVRRRPVDAVADHDRRAGRCARIGHHRRGELQRRDLRAVVRDRHPARVGRSRHGGARRDGQQREDEPARRAINRTA